MDAEVGQGFDLGSRRFSGAGSRVDLQDQILDALRTQRKDRFDGQSQECSFGDFEVGIYGGIPVDRFLGHRSWHFEDRVGCAEQAGDRHRLNGVGDVLQAVWIVWGRNSPGAGEEETFRWKRSAGAAIHQEVFDTKDMAVGADNTELETFALGPEPMGRWMVRFAGFRPDEAQRSVDVAGPCEGDEQGLVAMVARLAHDKELAGGIGSHGRPFHAHFDALFASIGDQAGEDEAVGITGELAEFVLMNAVNAHPVLRMTVGTVFEGAVELGMHGGYREEHDSDMEPERHSAKEECGPWRCQRAIPTDAWNPALQPRMDHAARNHLLRRVRPR